MTDEFTPNVCDVREGRTEPPASQPEPTKLPPSPRLSELVQKEGAEVTFYAAASTELKKTKTKKPFVSWEFYDGKSTIFGTQFDTSEAFETGVFKVRGKFEKYNDVMRIRVSKVRPVDDSDDIDADLSSWIEIRESEFAAAELVDKFNAALEWISEPVRNVVLDILETLGPAFAEAPASVQYHHAFTRGLFEHTTSMLGAASAIVGHYSKMYPATPINADVVYSAIVLHDAFKAIDARLDAAEWIPTNESFLIGHIAASAHAILSQTWPDGIGQDIAHAVLSHHGTLEFGSPVPPRTIEAFIVHSVDMLDSKLFMYREAVVGVAPGEMSPYSYALRTVVRSGRGEA